jgi:hypothetical protein
VGLHQRKRLLYIKGNNYQFEDTAYRMGKNFWQLYSSYKGLIYRIYKELER